MVAAAAVACGVVSARLTATAVRLVGCHRLAGRGCLGGVRSRALGLRRCPRRAAAVAAARPGGGRGGALGGDGLDGAPTTRRLHPARRIGDRRRDVSGRRGGVLQRCPVAGCGLGGRSGPRGPRAARSGLGARVGRADERLGSDGDGVRLGRRRKAHGGRRGRGAGNRGDPHWAPGRTWSGYGDVKIAPMVCCAGWVSWDSFGGIWLAAATAGAAVWLSVLVGGLVTVVSPRLHTNGIPLGAFLPGATLAVAVAGGLAVAPATTQPQRDIHSPITLLETHSLHRRQAQRASV